MESDKFDDNFDKYRNGIIIKVAKIAQQVSELHQKRLEKKGKTKNIYVHMCIQKLRTCHIAYVISIQRVINLANPRPSWGILFLTHALRRLLFGL